MYLLSKLCQLLTKVKSCLSREMQYSVHPTDFSQCARINKSARSRFKECQGGIACC